MDKRATVVNNSEHSSKLGTFLHPISQVVASRKGPNDALGATPEQTTIRSR